MKTKNTKKRKKVIKLTIGKHTCSTCTGGHK